MLPYEKVEYEEKKRSVQVEKALSAFIMGIIRNTDRTILAQICKSSKDFPMDDCDWIPDKFDTSWLEVEEMVKGLTDRQKVVFQIVYIEGRRPADAARRLEVSHSAVRQILKRIQERLDVWMADKGYDYDG